MKLNAPLLRSSDSIQRSSMFSLNHPSCDISQLRSAITRFLNGAAIADQRAMLVANVQMRRTLYSTLDANSYLMDKVDQDKEGGDAFRRDFFRAEVLIKHNASQECAGFDGIYPPSQLVEILFGLTCRSKSKRP